MMEAAAVDMEERDRWSWTPSWREAVNIHLS